MATWQQAGNSGALLAGLGGMNSNAPRASDADATLAYIRQNNEMERSGRNNVGLQALQGISSVMDMYKQMDQQKRQQEFQQAYADAYTSGDRDAMRKLASQYPEQFDAVRNGMKFVDEDQRSTVGTLAASARLAASSPEAMMSWLQNNSSELTRAGVDPLDVAKMYQQNPQGFTEFVDHLGMAALGPIDYFNVQDKMAGREIDRGRLAETIRSNQAGEALTARGQNITMRGQDLSASTTRRGQDLAMQRASMKGAVGNNERTVQLADGRTVTVGGKLHGAGANAFYEGIDNEGNMVRVPAGSIAAPATSAASAQNYAMKKDLDAISGASIDDLGFMTGITGSSGSPALGADIRSRASGGDQRKLYNAAQRIQGKMRNQGIAAARDMGASGINTVAEAKMYFQGMPQVDFSSPEALQQSMRDIQQYTDNYNQQYNVNVGNGGKKSSMQQPPTQQSAGGSYTSKSGIQFTVE
ncbi:phage DNA ejection protein [Salmonella enterica subsp. enterica serovar Schwarzengrund]|nr:DNA transfer protein [Salmonella enterica subsp. enterica serovar Schwarzengrund]EDC2933243.1 DNA transfer protein [Salmonella enterica subsp. enterica serovar Schwarzengrund]EDM4244744.1 DNA transfer protein [Salmonella enterica subsp. enterica serovar Schwarzengrund]EKC1292861.1 phage DNA ejection protein [Salmonella enterica subsp. enterica serovar Schwarzengrund]ELI5307755.1 phage DNA ejection protein [Salmonella enterica subsp. enterica serovar Schwarzengrund]